MKTVVCVLYVMSFLCFNLSVKSQIRIGGGFDYNIIPGSGFSTASFTLGGLNLLSQDNKAVFANFSFFFPKSKTYETTAYAYSSFTIPNSISVDVTEKLSIFSLNGGIKMHFGERSLEEGSLFFSAGVGFLYGKQKFSYSYYDRADYSVNSTGDQTIFDLFGIIGIGYDFNVNEKLSISADLPVSVTIMGISLREGSNSPVRLMMISPGISVKYRVVE